MQTSLKIDPEFQSLIPPLSDEEFRQLEENITSLQKCRDALISWKDTIIDGHNRYAICQKHGIPYEVSEIRFPSRKEAKLWILENQLGRRNLSDANRIELAAQKASLTRPKHKRKEIAATAKLCEQTVQKYMKIKESADPNLLAQVTSGELKIGTAYKTLLVTTVQPICTPEELKEFNKQYQKPNMLNAIKKIEKLYKSISKNKLKQAGMEDTASIQKKLKLQLKQLNRHIAHFFL